MHQIHKTSEMCIGCERNSPSYIQKILGRSACSSPIKLTYSSYFADGESTIGIDGFRLYCPEQKYLDVSIHWTAKDDKCLSRVILTEPSQLGRFSYSEPVEFPGFKPLSLEIDPNSSVKIEDCWPW